MPCTFINAAAKERGVHVSMLRNYFVLRWTTKKTRGLPKFVKRVHVWNAKSRSGKERTYITDAGLEQFDKDRREAAPPEQPGTWLTYEEQVQPFGFGRNSSESTASPSEATSAQDLGKGDGANLASGSTPSSRRTRTQPTEAKCTSEVKRTAIKKRRKEWVYHRDDLQTLYDLIRPRDKSLWLTAQQAKDDLLRIPLGLLWQWTVRKCPLLGRKLKPEEFAGPDVRGRTVKVFKYRRSALTIEDVVTEVWGINSDTNDRVLRTVVSRLTTALLNVPDFPWSYCVTSGQVLRILRK